MKPPIFEYRRPATLKEALDLLREYGGDAKVLAGGQSLVPMMNLRMVRPEVVVDINRLSELDYIRLDGRTLAIGALTRHQTLLESEEIAKGCPLMSEAYRYVAHLPIRNRGTLGGNICHSDPSSEMPAVLLACDAQITVASHSGIRQLAINDFLLGPLQTTIGPDEIVTEIRIPLRSQNEGWAFREVSARRGDFAMAAIGTILQVSGGEIARASIAVAGMGDRATRLSGVEQLLLKQRISKSLLADASAKAAELVNPDSSHQASAGYKRSLVQTLVASTLADAVSRSNA